MSDVGEDDFYVVLPSNSNPETHPNNNASKYIVSWENPINFGNSRDWRVALTEMTYNFSPQTVTNSYGIEYNILERDVWSRKMALHAVKGRGPVVKMNTLKPSTSFKHITSNTPQVTFTTDGRLVINSDDSFRLIFKSKEQAKMCGFNQSSNVSTAAASANFHRLEADERFFKTIDQSIQVDDIHFIQHSFIHQRVGVIFFRKAVHWNDVAELVTALHETFREIFDNVQFLEASQRIQLHLKPIITSIRFLGGLNLILGFSQISYANAILTSDFAPHLNRGLNNLYVYASICAPIQVGHSRVPLLRSVWVNVNKSFFPAEIRNVDIKHPMYVPINSASITSIEINIRTDSGALVPFNEGSITSLTLHFKKVKKT